MFPSLSAGVGGGPHACETLPGRREMAASKPSASRISVAHASSFTKHQQRYHVPSTKEFAWAISRVFNGYFTLAGQGDMSSMQGDYLALSNSL